MMIPSGECTYAGRKRRKPIQKRRLTMGTEKSNPSKRHRDRLNTELDHLASLLPFSPDIISKLDKLSVLRLSVSYLRVKSFFQALQETCVWSAPALSPEDHSSRGFPVQEGRLLLESLNGFALVVSAEGMIFYASATIVDYLGFHQTDVMHQNIYDYIHVDDRQDFCRQLHWAMDPPQVVFGQSPHADTDNTVLGKLLRAQEGGKGLPSEYSAFLTRCFICRVRCLLDSTSGFLTMQFQGKLKFLFGQKKKTPSGTALPPRLSLFCIVAPVLPSVTEMKMKSAFLKAKHRADIVVTMDSRAKAVTSLCESELHPKLNYLAGRSNGENVISLFRGQTDRSHWTRALARSSCLCLRGGPDLLDPKGTSGDREEDDQKHILRRSPGARGQREMHKYSYGLETPVHLRHLDWSTEQRSQEGTTKLTRQPSKSEPSTCLVPHGSCVPYPGSQGMFSASNMASFRESLDHPTGTYCSQMNRPLPDIHQGQVDPSTCHIPQGSLGSRIPLSGMQCFTARGFSTEDAKLPSLPVNIGTPCNPVLSLEVPIKMENESGSQDIVEASTTSCVWLGTGDMTRRHLVGFPARMHLKTEPDYRQQVCTPHRGHGILGTNPHSRDTVGSCREHAPLYSAHCTCLSPEPPHHLFMCSHSESQHPSLDQDCRAPIVKREPLDSPSWAAPGHVTVPRMFPKNASITVIPSKGSDGIFLP
ncbi:aryl-hydrocarbon receptor repressor [Rattus norvegicus]|uniref:Aryl hydrocarbon receptor repressor n=2 Tax=Rattus norvegicus TaxID=10116 RepID=AHRR_RAT|nr:aryl hydrocarbon receptor repressor [Rattus norvegicus]Q75NT5.1 RecName: Full=Aryl hydrocarbon receptor repressor; Short=AhR repressor; Short=AhRR [Rattus norvegicus]pir/JC8065/ aryl hydrocarbon receptor repressor - rat [Rattus norvegicus]AAR15509.1 aryl-hydrocarbon receptor repressor [Rattus norvegicus]EDL87680.1 aryl-hydrocarbon receptor repressor [Rattus norvegicus]BAD13341.1 AhR repressor [Rattus norvegicus]|eukprot:NP_001019456.1 aryl hydrocarbon receptor repressor [Rattus norvegicus]